MKSTKKFDLEAILERVYPRVYRVALALCQNRDVGLAVVTRVLGQSGVVFERWESDEEADRWFLRYVVLCSRGQEAGETDPLMTRLGKGSSWRFGICRCSSARRICCITAKHWIFGNWQRQWIAVHRRRPSIYRLPKLR